ncbi:hypothetical protein CR513_34846, partial [Mucuna pruriens]
MYHDLSHNNTIEYHDIVLRSIFEDGVYIFDSMVMFCNNRKTNIRVLRSNEDDNYIVDSIDFGHNYNMENNGRVSRVELANQESIKNLEMFTIQEEMDQSLDSILSSIFDYLMARQVKF